MRAREGEIRRVPFPASQAGQGKDIKLLESLSARLIAKKLYEQQHAGFKICAVYILRFDISHRNRFLVTFTDHTTS